jgi:hypothetical protein
VKTAEQIAYGHKRDLRNRIRFELQESTWPLLDPVDQAYLLSMQRCEIGSRCGCAPCTCRSLQLASIAPATEIEKPWNEIQ